MISAVFPELSPSLQPLLFHFSSACVAPPSGRIETCGKTGSLNFFLLVKLLTLYKCMGFLLDSRHRGAQSPGSVTATYIPGERGGDEGAGGLDCRAYLCRSKGGKVRLGPSGISGDLRHPAWKSHLGFWSQLCDLPAL